MNKKLLTFVFLILVPFGLFSQHNRQRVWVVDEFAYPNTMTWVLQVAYQGVMDPTLEIGAFCGDECRGIVDARYESVLNDYRWYLNIQGQGGETLNFYVRRDGVELDAVTDFTFVFEENGKLGTIANPYVIDFHTIESSYYMLITDESQLVAGRKYLIANGFEGTVKAMGKQNASNRSAVEMDCANRKTYQTPAVNAAEDAVFQFTLGGSTGAWTWRDEAGNGYVVINDDGILTVADTPCDWVIDLSPTGISNISMTLDEETKYIGFYNDFFRSRNTVSSLYLFAKCELVSGTMASLTTDDPAAMFVVEAGNTLNVTDLSTVDVSNLFIEDGAQLVNASSNVLATLQKSVTAYDDASMRDGWFTLASPMAATAVETGSNLIFPDYDLYSFDETNLTHEEWRNYKTAGNFTDFEAGRGYLYANATTFMPLFKGTLNHDAITFPMTYTAERPDVLTGFNLVGNPFPHNIYKGAGGAIDDSGLASGYYVLTHSGAWEAKTYDMPIAPGQGILVKTTAAHSLNIAKTNASALGESTSGNAKGNVMSRIGLRVSNGNDEDVAYVYLGKGNNLVKMRHLNAASPSLAVMQADGDFAIAHVDADCEVIDLRFANKRTATYTITVDVKDYMNGYLHLIDNLTGADVDLLRTLTYTFKATGQDYPCRFRLVLQGSDSEDNNAPFAYFADGEIHLMVETQDHASLQIVDMMGRVVRCTDDVRIVSTRGMVLGVYMLRLIDGDDVRTQKIMVR